MDTRERTFVADQIGPPRRRFWISRNPPTTSNMYVSGWMFAFDEMGADGNWKSGWDTWEEFCFEILRYPAVHAAEPLTWRRESTGEVIDLAVLQPLYDGRSASSDDTPETAGLRLPDR